jgi:hypothetical protein
MFARTIFYSPLIVFSFSYACLLFEDSFFLVYSLVFKIKYQVLPIWVLKVVKQMEVADSRMLLLSA